MSNALTRAARHLAMPPNDKAVLMALADMARDADDPDSPCQAWPPMHGRDGAVGLCEWTCLSERAVQRSVKSLVAAGLIGRRQLSHGALYTVRVSPVPPSGDCPSGDCQTPSPVPQSPKAQQSTIKRKKTSSSPSPRAVQRPPQSDSLIGGALDLPALPPGSSEAQWSDYVEMRVAMARADKKRPWTPATARKAIEKLHALAFAGNDPGAVLDQSVLNTWQGLFPVKDDQHGRRADQYGSAGNAGTGRGRPVDGFTAALREIQTRGAADDYGGS